MLKAQWDGPEIITEGTVQEGDKYLGFCCKGHDWEVFHIFSEQSIWGTCDNLDCPNYQVDIGPDDPYRGVKYICLEDFEEWLADESTRIYNECCAGHWADFDVCGHPDCERVRIKTAA
jgi:hypothetical protein